MTAQVSTVVIYTRFIFSPSVKILRIFDPQDDISSLTLYICIFALHLGSLYLFILFHAAL